MENPQLWIAQLRGGIKASFLYALELEYLYAEDTMPRGVPGLNASVFAGYLRCIVNSRAQQIGLDPMFAQEENPFPWMREMVDWKMECNFLKHGSSDIEQVKRPIGNAYRAACNEGRMPAPGLHRNRSPSDTQCQWCTSRKQRKNGRLSPHLMDSKKTNRPNQFLPPNLIISGKAAFSLKKPEIFQDLNSSASVTAGVFSGYNRSIVA